MSDQDTDATQHAIVDLNRGAGSETARHVLEYIVGPPCNWEFFYTPRGELRLILWGEHFEERYLRDLADASHSREQEMSEMDMYGAAQEASKTEGAFHRAEVHNVE